MKSILKLYEVEFKPELNPLVENLADYLAQCERSTYNDFQYMKHDLSIVVKIPMGQEFVDNFAFNYASIQNEGESVFYYYILDMSWVAQNTIALTLGMDTVNTLGQPGSLGHPAMFTDETHIYRQHGDRFYDTGQRDQAGGKLLRRRIDREAEGFDVPKEQTSASVMNDRNFAEGQWAVMYKTAEGADLNEINPLGVYLVPKFDCSARLGNSTEAFVINPEDLTPGYYYFLSTDNPGGQFVYTRRSFWEVFSPIEDATDSWSCSVNDREYYIIEKNANGKLFVHGYGEWANWKELNWGSAYVYEAKNIRVLKGTLLRRSNTNYAEQSLSQIVAQTSTTNVFNCPAGVETTAIRTIGDVDRYNPRILKIVDFPYCPINLSMDSSRVVAFPENWTLSEGFIKWNGYGLPNFYYENAANFTINLVSYWYPNAKQTKEVGCESKLYHSELFTFKAVYDSFAKEIALERFDLSETDPGRITVDFKPTNTLGNNMLFKFNFDDFAPYKDVVDYENYLLVDRNNEEPIFTSNYLNYLNNGYAYDVASNKIAANRALTEAITSTLGASVNTAANIYSKWQPQEILTGYLSKTTGRLLKKDSTLVKKDPDKYTPYTQQIPAGFRGAEGLVFQNVISSAMNAANSWLNYNNLLKTQKIQMATKMTELQAQSIGVNGSGTIDLLEEYNGNKLIRMVYEPRLTIKRRLYDFFDYFGYSHDYYEVPNISSRYWYNYIQCSPILVEEGLGKYKEVWLEDLKARYEIGVTVFHDRNGEWNFKRRWENWETWVITE